MRSVVGYVRISSRGQEKGFGKDLQLRAIQELCKVKGYELIGVYSDSAKSGTEKGFESREAFHRMINDCHEKQIRKIVIYDLSRLWRDDVTKFLIKKELIKYGLEILSFNQPQYSIDSKDASEYLISNLLDALATFERMNILSRLSAGRKAKLATGKFGGGGVSLGFKAENKDLVVNEEEMKLVRKIFSMKRRGMSTYAIAKHLTSTGVKGKLGGRIEPSTIRNVLKSKLYKGFLKYGDTLYKAPQYKI